MFTIPKSLEDGVNTERAMRSLASIKWMEQRRQFTMCWVKILTTRLPVAFKTIKSRWYIAIVLSMLLQWAQSSHAINSTNSSHKAQPAPVPHQLSTNQSYSTLLTPPPTIWLLTAWPGRPGWPSLPGRPCKKELRLNWFSLRSHSGHLLRRRVKGKVAKALGPLLVCVPAWSLQLFF